MGLKDTHFFNNFNITQLLVQRVLLFATLYVLLVLLLELLLLLFKLIVIDSSVINKIVHGFLC
jgi:hypothetical protein